MTNELAPSNGSNHNNANGLTRRQFLYYAGVSAALAALANPVKAFATGEATSEVAAATGTAPNSFIGGFYYAGEGKNVGGNSQFKDELLTQFYFNTNFFDTPAFTYDPHMATFGCCLACAAFGANKGGNTDFTNKDMNARYFLEKVGCDSGSICSNDDFRKKPGPDTIGLVCGSRKITSADGKEYNLILMGVRGAGYGREWMSNLKAGDQNNSGNLANHKGFTEAATKAISFLKSYVSGQGLTGPTKVLIAGYSRAAATTNLTAGGIVNEAKLNEHTAISDEVGYDLSSVFDKQIELYQKDFYAYCYEAPAGAYVASGQNKANFVSDYRNIHSIINPCDLVPRVMPADWQFVRYGTDMMLPGPGKTTKDNAVFQLAEQRMFERAKALAEDVDYKAVDDFPAIQYQTWFVKAIADCRNMDPLNYYLTDFFKGIMDIYIIHDGDKSTASDYIKNHQETLRKAFDVYTYFNEDESKEAKQAFFSKLGGEYDTFGKLNILLEFLFNEIAIKHAGWFRNAKVSRAYRTDLEKSLSEAFKYADEKTGSNLYGRYYKVACELIEGILTDELRSFFFNDPCRTLAFMAKSSSMIHVHMPGTVLSWMQAMDSNYVKYPVVLKTASSSTKAVAATNSAAIAAAATGSTAVAAASNTEEAAASSAGSTAAGTSNAAAGTSNAEATTNNAAAATENSAVAGASDAGNQQNVAASDASNAQSAANANDAGANAQSAANANDAGAGANSATTAAEGNDAAQGSVAASTLGASSEAGSTNKQADGANTASNEDSNSAALAAENDASEASTLPADEDSSGFDGIIEYEPCDILLNYRKLRLFGDSLVVYYETDGQKYKLFENKKVVSNEGAELPFHYNLDYDLQMCIWLDADSKITFTATSDEGEKVEAILCHFDETDLNPTAVQAYKKMDDIFAEYNSYEFTAGSNFLGVQETAPNGAWNYESTSGTEPFNLPESYTGSYDSDTQFRTVNITAEPEEGGMILGGGKTLRNSNSLVAAYPDTGYEFAYWSLDGERIDSQDVNATTITGEEGRVLQVYYAYADEEHDVVAHFKQTSSTPSQDPGDNTDNTKPQDDAGDDDTGKDKAPSATAKTSDNSAVAAVAAAAVGAAAVANVAKSMAEKE